MPGLVQVASSICCFCVEHLGGVLEALVLEQALDEFAARIFGFALATLGGRARQQHLALDVDEQRRGVDEVAGDVDVGVLEVLDVGEKLRGDFRDGDVVDVDVLLADEVEQEVEGAVVDLADDDGKGEGRVGFSFSGRRGSFVCGGSDGRLGSRRGPVSPRDAGCAGSVGRVVLFGHRVARSDPIAAADFVHGLLGAGGGAACAVFEDVRDEAGLLFDSACGAPGWERGAATMASAAQLLHSMQPMPAVVQPS